MTPIALSMTLGLLACGGGEPTANPPSPDAAPPPPQATQARADAPAGPLPALILTQARFERVGGKVKPRPATLWLWRKGDDRWYDELIEDPESNVFHKGIWWRDGILTIGGMKARLVHWKRGGDAWQPTLLWEQTWGGRFDRLRDLELGDITGDGREDIVLATHDMGVVAIGVEDDAGEWTFTETPKVADTFVHEIEIGDVDGDGKLEFYATPSDRNRSSGASQAGGVARYDYRDGGLVETKVVHWEESHAKEILVTDLDGDGRDELYAVREAHVVIHDEPGGKRKERLTPVQVVQLVPDGDGWREDLVAEIPDDMARFLIAADLRGTGKPELITAGKTSGVWRIERDEAGGFTPHRIIEGSSGFEHAIHAADLDGDGQLELYVASDDQSELRSYRHTDGRFEPTVITPMPARALTWGIAEGRF